MVGADEVIERALRSQVNGDSELQSVESAQAATGPVSSDKPLGLLIMPTGQSHDRESLVCCIGKQPASQKVEIGGSNTTGSDLAGKYRLELNQAQP